MKYICDVNYKFRPDTWVMQFCQATIIRFFAQTHLVI